MPKVKTFLYAVRMLIPDHDPQPVKVGFSSNPDKRRLSYNSGPYKCEWLGVWPGTIEDEVAFHVRFYELNQGMTGEWFRPNQEFLDAVTRKINAYRAIVERQAARFEERERLRRAKEEEQARIDKEMRIRAAQCLEDRFSGPVLDLIRSSMKTNSLN